MKVQLKHLRTMKVRLERQQASLNAAKTKKAAIEQEIAKRLQDVDQAARQLDRVSGCWQGGKELSDHEASQFGLHPTNTNQPAIPVSSVA